MDNDVEYIVMGKGLGFQKKIGETVDKEKIEKTFVLENPETVAEWTRVYVDLPDAEMQVFLNIITFAEAVLQTKFDPSFFIALADHLHYAIERSREEISLQNPFLYEQAKTNYPKSFICTQKIVTYIKSSYAFELSLDEQVYLTIHIQRFRDNIDK